MNEPTKPASVAEQLEVAESKREAQILDQILDDIADMHGGLGPQVETPAPRLVLVR